MSVLLVAVPLTPLPPSSPHILQGCTFLFSKKAVSFFHHATLFPRNSPFICILNQRAALFCKVLQSLAFFFFHVREGLGGRIGPPLLQGSEQAGIPPQGAQLRTFPAGRLLSGKHRELSGQVTFVITPDISQP